MVGSDWDCFLGALFNRFFKGYQEKWVKKKTHKIAKMDLLLILLKFDHFGQLCVRNLHAIFDSNMLAT